MFQQNTEFRVTIRDFQDRCEPQVLKAAGPLFVRAIREQSAEYLENCFRGEGEVESDAELRWTVTLHQKLGIGTIHYVVYREDVGFEGKCLVYDLKAGPVPNRPWIPLVMRQGELKSDILPVNHEYEEDEYAEILKGVCQPKHQDFFSYYFKGWIPVTRITADLVEEDTARTLIGAGFSGDLVLGTTEYPLGLAKQLEDLRALHNSVVTNFNMKNEFNANPQSGYVTRLAARTYEFDQRAVKDSVAMKVSYLQIVPQQELTHTNFEAVFQEGGWLDGAFAKSEGLPQFLALQDWVRVVDYDTL